MTVLSDINFVKKGVLQGSILGPLLYIIYTNELPDILSKNMVQFADDTSIVFSAINNEDMNTEIHTALDSLKSWFTANNLVLNVEKTQLIKFSYSKRWLPTAYNSEQQTLTTVNAANFLGVAIDSRLDWKSHIDSLCTSLAKNCFALSVLAQNISIDTALAAYHAYVDSKLRYGIIFWGSSSEASRVLIIQKRCLRSIYHVSHMESCRPIFINNKILTSTCIYILESISFIKQNLDLFSKHVIEIIITTLDQEMI